MLGGAVANLQATGISQGVVSHLIQESASLKGFAGLQQLGWHHQQCRFGERSHSRRRFLTVNAYGQANNLRKRHSGVTYGRQHKDSRVACSESNITETFNETGLEVVKSLEEAETQSLRAVSGDIKELNKSVHTDTDDNNVAAKDEDADPSVQAAWEEIFAEEAESIKFQSFERDAIMAAAAKVAEALGESELEAHKEGQMYFHMLEPVSPVAAPVMVRDFSETFEATETAVQETEVREEVGFMVRPEAPEHHFPAPEPPPAVEESSTETTEAIVADSPVAEEVEEQHSLDPGAVASALMVREVADALKAPEEEQMSPALEKEIEAANLQQAEGKSLLEQLKDIIVFAGPALGIWLSGPIMGIIDTAVIGNSSSVELAALGKFSLWLSQCTNCVTHYPNVLMLYPARLVLFRHQMGDIVPLLNS